MIFLVVFVDLLGFGIVLPLLPVYAEHLMVNFSQTTRATLLGLLMTSFSLMQFVFSPFWGSLSDRVGRRPVIVVGLVGSTLCYTLFALACRWSHLPLMFAARFGAGIMGATIATAQAYIADVTPAQRRASGMALIGAAFGLGFTFGPLLGALALSLAPPEKAAVSTLPGLLGATFSGLALLLAIFLLPESLPRFLSRGPMEKTELASHKRAAHDWRLLFDIAVWQQILSQRVLLALLVAGFLMVFALSGFEATLSVTLADLWQNGEAVQDASLSRSILSVFVLIGLTQTVTQGLLVRRLSLVWSERSLCDLGLGLALGGFTVIAGALHHDRLVSLIPWVNPSVTAAVVVAASGIIAAGMAFVMPAVQSLISRQSDAEHQGQVFGIANSLSAIARIIGVLLAFQSRVLAASGPFWGAVFLLVITWVLLARTVGPSGKSTSSDSETTPRFQG